MCPPSMPPAHRCLRVSEIFQIIAESLCMSKSKRTLASLARTCKTLHDASLPALWEYQDSLVPLLRLLPPGTWLEVPRVHGGSSFQITQPDKLEWTRFEHYAQHVRFLDWREREDVSPPALSALSVHRPAGRPLLPRLRTLIWHEARMPYFSFVHLFLTRTISLLELMSGDFVPPVMVALFEHVGAACTRVERLEVCTDTLGDDMRAATGVVGDALARLLRGLPELECYKGEVFLPAGCVEALAALPRLVELELYVEHEEMDIIAASAARRPHGGRWFDTLEILSLSVDRMDRSTQTFLGAMPRRHLREVAVESRYQPDTYTAKQHLTLLACCGSLKSLQLDFDEATAACAALDVGDALQPLYACAHIDSLRIRSPLLAARPRALRDIAHAWRALEVLALVSGEPHCTDAPCVALADLAPLARACPALRVLELHVNADEVPDARVLARLRLPAPSRCPLRVLAAFDAPVEDPARVAAFLARVFPRVREVGYRGAVGFVDGLERTFERRWETVRELLEAGVDADVADDQPVSDTDSEYIL